MLSICFAFLCSVLGTGGIEHGMRQAGSWPLGRHYLIGRQKSSKFLDRAEYSNGILGAEGTVIAHRAVREDPSDVTSITRRSH